MSRDTVNLSAITGSAVNAAASAATASALRDPIAEGLARGWAVTDGRRLDQPLQMEADVVIIGSGAGGGIAADVLSRAGLSVILVEEGPLRSSRDFRMLESEAYPDLYQESAARKTADKAINILQGRAVGGSTTVNWTSSFRTPPATLSHWARHHGLQDFTPQDLAPWFDRVEQALGIAPWGIPPNPNNEALRRGGQLLGIPVEVIRRNVRGCWNLGYCGVGCPTNAKQSMLVTTIPAALDRGATLLHSVRAQRLVRQGDRITELQARPMDGAGLQPREVSIRLRARHFIVAGGAINSPALLMRSELPDESGLLGQRTFLHPTVIGSALMAEPVRGDAGAPQSLYSDHFLDTAPIEGTEIGFKLESAPLHPVLFATTLQGFGATHQALMQRFSHAQVLLALLRDGFQPDSPGGQVRLRRDGTPELHYPLGDAIWRSVRRALLTMAQIQLEAGAVEVTSVHEQASMWRTWEQARRGIEALDLRPLLTRVVSAHVMGGCAMGSDPRRSVTDARGRLHAIANLTVADGSLFPTSIGANPQESIYGIVLRQITELAQQLKPRA